MFRGYWNFVLVACLNGANATLLYFYSKPGFRVLQSGSHAETSVFVTPIDKSGLAEDYGAAGGWNG